MRKDGTRFWAFVVIDPIRNRSGEIIGFAKITRDLTERKAAEENLCRSEAAVQLLVQGVTDYAIYMLDKEGRVTNWNPGAQRIKGYLPDEIIGRHFSQFYTEEDREAGMPRKALETARGKVALKRKAGASARTAAASGRTSSSMPFAMTRGSLLATPRSPATSPSAKKPRRNSKRRVSFRSKRRKWRRSVNSPAASPTISTTC